MVAAGVEVDDAGEGGHVVERAGLGPQPARERASRRTTRGCRSPRRRPGPFDEVRLPPGGVEDLDEQAAGEPVRCRPGRSRRRRPRPRPARPAVVHVRLDGGRPRRRSCRLPPAWNPSSLQQQLGGLVVAEGQHLGRRSASAAEFWPATSVASAGACPAPGSPTTSTPRCSRRTVNTAAARVAGSGAGRSGAPGVAGRREGREPVVHRQGRTAGRSGSGR